MKINLNDIVKVKLTKIGRSILRKRHDKVRIDILSNGGRDIGEYTCKMEDDYYVAQLWYLIDVFKENFSLNSKQVFEDNSIIFIDEEYKYKNN